MSSARAVAKAIAGFLQVHADAAVLCPSLMQTHVGATVLLAFLMQTHVDATVLLAFLMQIHVDATVLLRAVFMQAHVDATHPACILLSIPDRLRKQEKIEYIYIWYLCVHIYI